MNFKPWLNESEYRGSHQAPSKGDGAPLHNMTETYPDDIYTLPLMTAARYYGDSVPEDIEAMSIIQSAKGRPNKPIKIYRAVPDLNKDIDRQIKKMAGWLAYLNKYGFSPWKDDEAIKINSEAGHDKDKFREIVSGKIAELEASRKKPFKINAGDWVTTVRKYAIDHGMSALGGNYKIVSKTVPAKHLYTEGNSIFEFGYDPS